MLGHTRHHGGRAGRRGRPGRPVTKSANGGSTSGGSGKATHEGLRSLLRGEGSWWAGSGDAGHHGHALALSCGLRSSPGASSTPTGLMVTWSRNGIPHPGNGHGRQPAQDRGNSTGRAPARIVPECRDRRSPLRSLPSATVRRTEAAICSARLRGEERSMVTSMSATLVSVRAQLVGELRGGLGIVDGAALLRLGARGAGEGRVDVHENGQHPSTDSPSGQGVAVLGLGTRDCCSSRRTGRADRPALGSWVPVDLPPRLRRTPVVR